MNYLRYTGIFVATLILIPAFLWLIARFTGLDLQSAGLSVLPPIVASAVEGQAFVRKHKRVPESSESWKFARMGAVIALGIGFVLLPIAAMFNPAIREMMGDSVLVGLLTAALLFWALIVLMANRWFIAVMARTEMAQLRKKGLDR